MRKRHKENTTNKSKGNEKRKIKMKINKLKKETK